MGKAPTTRVEAIKEDRLTDWFHESVDDTAGRTIEAINRTCGASAAGKRPLTDEEEEQLHTAGGTPAESGSRGGEPPGKAAGAEHNRGQCEDNDSNRRGSQAQHP